MPKQDVFLGKEITTSSGSSLKVVESFLTEDKRKRYICECSVCSEDTKLWPYGSINAPKYNLENGNIPCGCAKIPKWKSWQRDIQIERECIERGYEFKGYVGGKYKNEKTKIILHNPETGNLWESTSVGKFLSGQGDPSYPHYLSNRKPDQFYIDMFLSTGKFPEGTVFSRNEVRKDKYGCYSFWDVTCPLCKKDYYSKNGLPFKFTASTSSLRLGALPCRCYKGYTKSQEEIECLISKICQEENISFLSFKEDYTTVKETEVLWTCSENHKNDTNLYDFIHGVRCRRCYDNMPRQQNGYYKTRLEEDDSLYIIIFNKGSERFFKVGRSFIATKYPRELYLKRVIGADDVETVVRVYGKHKDIWELEKTLLDIFREDYRYSFDKPFKGSSECLEVECLNELLSELDKLTKNNHKFYYKTGEQN